MAVDAEEDDVVAAVCLQIFREVGTVEGWNDVVAGVVAGGAAGDALVDSVFAVEGVSVEVVEVRVEVGVAAFWVEF